MSIKVVYIAGHGHSGSTLIDIYLGNVTDGYSIGELIQFTRESITDEKCSCGQRNADCEFWSEVFNEWEQNRKLDPAIFSQIYQKYRVSVRNNFWVFWNHRFPSQEMRMFWEDVKLLYKIVDAKSQSAFLIESSLNPLRLVLLKKVLGKDSIWCVCLVRNFVDVLASFKKPYKKDLKSGIEKDIAPKPTVKTAIKYISGNSFSRLFSFRLKSMRLDYDDFVNLDQSKLDLVNFVPGQSNGRATSPGKLIPGHLLAGNRMRLKESIEIQPQKSNRKYLSKSQINFARVVDAVMGN